jgi:hypothetical protein
MSYRAKDFQVGQLVRLIDTANEPDYLGPGLIGRLGVVDHHSVYNHEYLVVHHLRPDGRSADPFAWNLEPADDCEEELAAQRMLDELSR